MTRFTIFSRIIDASSDDFYIPLFFLCLFRIAWIPTFTIELLGLQKSCTITSTYIYIAVYLALSILLLVVEATCFIFSISGTISNSKPRDPLKILAPVEVVFRIFEWCVQIYGMYAIFFDKSSYEIVKECTKDTGFDYLVLRIASFWSLIVTTIFLVSVCRFLTQSRPVSMRGIDDWKLNIPFWEKRLRLLVKSGNDTEANETIKSTAIALAEYSKNLDWTASDFAAGMMLLRKEQRILRELTEIQNTTEKPLSFNTASLIRSHGIDMSKISRAVTKKMAQMSNPARKNITRKFTSKPPKLASRPTTRKKTTVVETRASSRGSNEFTITSQSSEKTLSFLQDLPISQENLGWDFGEYAFDLSSQVEHIQQSDILDIIHFAHYANIAYANLESDDRFDIEALRHYSRSNDFFRAPYLVSLDHDWHTIVVAIRGTSTSYDILCDMNFDQAELDGDLPEPSKYKVHAGFLLSAKNMLKDLLFSRALQRILIDPLYAHYRIVVTGHSMGAGIGSILTYLLRKQGFKQARCYSYCAPASTNDLVGTMFEEFCISIVNGHDIVSRLSHYAFLVMRDDLERLMLDCDVPKYKVMANFLIPKLFGRKKISERSLKNPNIDSKDLEKALRHNKEWTNGYNSILRLRHQNQIEIEALGVPGRILYIERIRDFAKKFKSTDGLARLKTYRQKQKGNETLLLLEEKLADRVASSNFEKNERYYYVPRWAERDEFREMQFSHTMLSDHSFVFKVLQQFEDHHPDLPLRASS